MLECLAQGVPHVAIPITFDQPGDSPLPREMNQIVQIKIDASRVSERQL